MNDGEYVMYTEKWYIYPFCYLPETELNAACLLCNSILIKKVGNQHDTCLWKGPVLATHNPSIEEYQLDRICVELTKSGSGQRDEEVQTYCCEHMELASKMHLPNKWLTSKGMEGSNKEYLNTDLFELWTL